MNRAVFLGLTTIDIINYVNHYPGSNEKIRAAMQLTYAGGPAANAAVAYTALGNSALLITGIGGQPIADLAKKDLHRHSIELLDMTNDKQLLPVLSSIIVDESTGNRSVVYADTTARKLKDNCLRQKILTDASLVMLDGHYLDQAQQLAEMAHDLSIAVVLDGGSWKTGLERVLPLIDYAICSENFRPPNCCNTHDIVQYLQGAGVGSISISRGDAPLYAYAGGTSTEVEVKKVNALDTLGAGDILHGAFCHFISEMSFFESLKRAADVASESCMYRGTRQWIEHLHD
jgi:sugar/nucleoside kinase (ribokinase family)